MGTLTKRKKKKIFLLVIVIAVTAIVLIVETYAWFVGLSTVDTNSFNINVSTGGGLEISLDGEHWKKDDQVLTISSSTITATSGSGDHAYEGNTNKWTGEKGLIPVSTVGLLDTTTGHLKFYEKSSLSSTAGGYKIVASQVDNSTQEADGYVVFDLFIRNGADNVYANGNYGTSGAENVYLKKTSSATVNGSSNYGAANSLCSYSGVTTGRENAWNIWEPNDVNHKAKAINAFEKCKTCNSDGTYNSSTNCNAIVDGTTTLPTYAVNKVVQISDHVNIYDGLNGYTGSSTGDNNFLREVTNLKESTNGVDTVNPYNTRRNQIIRLLPNTITKVRVYVWLEGQDPDNLDYLGESKKLLIKFGFTKDMYEEEPTNRTNP